MTMEIKMTTKGQISRGRTSTGEPNPIDIHVGNRIRLRRTVLGLSQDQLGALLGLTFQQIQKYERGINRVSASRIWDVAKVLDVDVSFFFEEIGIQAAGQSPRLIAQPKSNVESVFDDIKETDPMMRQETIELVRAYYKIRNNQMAKQVYTLLVSLSKTTDSQ